MNIFQLELLLWVVIFKAHTGATNKENFTTCNSFLTQNSYFRISCYRALSVSDPHPPNLEFSVFWACCFHNIPYACQYGKYYFRIGNLANVPSTELRKIVHWIIVYKKKCQCLTVSHVFGRHTLFDLHNL